MARLARHDDGRTAQARANRRDRRDRVRGVHAFRRLFDGRPLCRDWAPSRPGNPGGDHRQPAAVVVADGVAGHGVGDARLLRAFRSRSHPFVAGCRAAGVRSSHRHDGALDRPDGRIAGRAVHQCPGGIGRAALARRLWRGGSARARRDRGRHCTDDRAVQDHRPKAYPIYCANRRRGDRRRLRDRAAIRRNPLLRQLVPDRLPAIGGIARACAGPRQHALLASPRRARRRAGAGRRDRRKPPPARISIVLFAPRFGDHAIAAAGVSHTVTRQRRGSSAFAPRARRGPCDTRSGRCCGAIPG